MPKDETFSFLCSLVRTCCCADLFLYKNKSAQQHVLTREQRKLNVSSFGINNCKLDGMKIILCDDVITTGSTAEKCTELLKAKGAAEVYVAAGTTTKLEKGMN